jgi:hypothetical protein
VTAARSAAPRPPRGPRLDRRRVALVPCGDEAVLFDLRTYGATRANAAAAWVLRRLDGRRRSRTLAAGLSAAFAIAPRRARGDLDRLLGELRRRGLLRRSEG